MKAILLASLVLFSAVFTAYGQKPYDHPEGSIAHQAAQVYTKTVYSAYNNWQAMRISRQRFLALKSTAWKKYINTAFPPEAPQVSQSPDYSSELVDIEQNQRRLEQRIQQQNAERSAKQYRDAVDETYRLNQERNNRLYPDR